MLGIWDTDQWSMSYPLVATFESITLAEPGTDQFRNKQITMTKFKKTNLFGSLDIEIWNFIEIWCFEFEISGYLNTRYIISKKYLSI